MTGPPEWTSPHAPARSAAASAARRDWSGYFDAVADAGPRDTLVEAADRFEAEQAVAADAPPLAIDLGCGTGRDTLELLRRGWRVLALDGEPAAIERMLARSEFAATRSLQRLDARVGPFEQIDLPPCLLFNASYALPFCPPGMFGDLWRRIVSSIEPGGRFAGQFFGEQDEWAVLPDRTHHTAEQVQALLASFDVETLRTDLYGPDPASSFPKRWHVFHVVARKVR